MAEQLFEFAASDIQNIMIIKKEFSVRVVIGTVCVIEVYGPEDRNEDLGPPPTVEVLTEEELKQRYPDEAA